MRFLDMTPYLPFRPMGTTCLRRPISEKKMIWKRPEPKMLGNGLFRGRLLELKDLVAVAELWRQAYPEIYGSAHDFLLFSDEIAGKVVLADTWETDTLTRPCLMLIAEEVATGRLVAAALMTKFDRNLQIEYTVMGTHPEFRKLGLMDLLGKMMHSIAQDSGAEYLTAFLESWHTITQARALKLGEGWKIAGIFPGNFTRWAGNQEEYRGCEVYLYKFINGGEKYVTQPREWHLHPDLAKLWKVMEEVNRTLSDEI
jgi:hypothetical protein